MRRTSACRSRGPSNLITTGTEMAAGTPLERSVRAVQRRLAVAFVALAATLPAQASLLQESVLRVPVVAGVEQAYIDVTVFRPQGAGPFPIVVLSHGSPRSPQERRAEGRQRLAAQSAR